MTDPVSADGMLYLIRAEPSLLPAAPSGVDVAKAIEHRRHDEVHTCFRCGGRAQCAFVAHTEMGDRWLDLCADCAAWVHRTAS